MLFIPSTLHSRCCDINAILYQINCYIHKQSLKEMSKLKYRFGCKIDYDAYEDLLIYKDILISWANGNKYDLSLETIISRIKQIITK